MLPSKPWIIGIDPGTFESGYVICDENLKPLAFNKIDNEKLCYEAFIKTMELWDEQYGADLVPADRDTVTFFDGIHVAIEMIASYGQNVGREIFDTCVWIGRFKEQLSAFKNQQIIYRREERLTICESPKANDTMIRAALVDRFAPYVPNHGKGNKKNPGWFYGFRADIWQAYAVAVTYHDKYIEGGKG